MQKTVDTSGVQQPQVGPLSGRPPTEPQGPRRRAPVYYAGETIGRNRINYPDVERYANGAIAGIRDKQARRLIRSKLIRRGKDLESGLQLARAMKAQAIEVVRDEHKKKSRAAKQRMAKRLFAQELAIHQPVYVPTKKQIRAARTENRKRARKGLPPLTSINDAISQLVDRRR